MIKPIWASLAVIAGVVSTSAAKEIYVVPTDFPTVQEAIDFATNGDVILIDPVNEPYPGFTLNKTIWIMGTGTERIKIEGPIEVIGLPEEERISISNLSVSSDMNSISLIEDCAGDVVFDNMDFLHLLIGLQITDSADVALSNVQAEFNIGPLSLSVAPTIRIFNSNVRIDDCIFKGGTNTWFSGEGLDAVAAHNSLVVISNSQLSGGTDAFAGSGGNGLSLYAGSRAIIVGDAADEINQGRLTNGATSGWAVDVCGDCEVEYGLVSVEAINNQGGNVAQNDLLPYLEIDGNLVPGGNVDLQMNSAFGLAPAFVLISTFSDINTNFHLPLNFSDQGANFAVGSATETDGTLFVGFQIPDNDIFQGFRFLSQFAVVTDDGIFVTNAVDRLIAGF